MSVGKASIKRAVSAGTKKSTVSGDAVKQTVLTPMNSEEIQVKFFTEKKRIPEPGAPVKITEELPDFLL